MPWWTAQFHALGKEYHSGMVPFKYLPGLEEVHNKLGHKFETKEVTIKAGGVEADLRVSCLWVPGRDPLTVEGACRVVLFKKTFQPTGKPVYFEIHIGITDAEGAGYIAVVDGSDIRVEKRTASGILEEVCR